MAQKKNEEKTNIVRIASTDIVDTNNLFYGLANIKGIGFMMSNAICEVLKLDKSRKIKDLSDKEIETIENYLSSKMNEIPPWLKNQRFDPHSGENLHIVGKDLDFNLIKVKRALSKLKSYRGLRLRLGLPVRGQRTKSNFRKNKTIASMKAKSLKKKEGTNN